MIKVIILLLIFFPSSNLVGQPFVNVRDQYYQKHIGDIVLNNGKKIKGHFEYAFWEFPTYNLRSYSSSDKMVKRYYISKIKKVVLAGSDGWLSIMDSTYFIVHDKSRHFYRQLTFEKDFQLYDGFFNVDEYVGLVTDYFLVKAKGKFIKLNSAKKLIKWLQENEGDKIKWKKDITVQQIIRQLNGLNVDK